ncbi:hypothetical protein C9I98_07500 [Photobacterium sanctipauli]|uniref:Uncharacterized protein n=1 Tax=Photobacterium sanctipauli TaxID=1342794 RepID=A0A2T3NWL4_9GAMM|nr:hypothetical protein [Photobacterium sanctipauli]PSW20683.1 hypothetical protein C9I98_07500 [Photobacterium sanctipauli]
MYDTEMKLNHQIVQFLDTQLHSLMPSLSEPECHDSHGSPAFLTPNHQALLSAMLMSLDQYLSGLKAINCLLQKGYVSQTRGLFQTLGDDYEDIIFLSLPAQDGKMSALHRDYLLESQSGECTQCYSPLSRCEMRSMIRKAKHINHNVFQLFPKKQALQVLRPHGGKPCSVEVAIELHKHFAYKAILLAVLTAKVAQDESIMRACLNYRAHLEMIDPSAVDASKLQVATALQVEEDAKKVVSL